MPFQTKVYLLIFGLLVVNYLPRLFPMVILSKLKIPDVIIEWLGFVPAAVLAAITAQAVLMPNQKLFVSLGNNYLLAAIPAFAIALKTRSLVWTLISGMLAMALLQMH